MSCNRFDSSKEDAASGYSAISDSIKNQLIQAYNEDTIKPKPPFLTWLNLNGGYILAFKYIDDSLQQHPDNQLALQGADIAYQHSYMEKSIAFLSHFKPQSERDSIELWFRQLRVCASKIYTLTDEEVYANINRHLNFIHTDEHLSFQYISDLGRHYHNHGTYDSAVKYDQMAYQIAHDKGYSHEDIAMTCQRLGGEYADSDPLIPREGDPTIPRQSDPSFPR